MTAPVVVVGDALIDELRDDHGVREFVGGAALNVAVGLARLGVESSLIAMVGDDDAGARIRSQLADFGVALLASPAPRGSSRAVSTRAARGEPVYEFNRAARERRITFDDAQRAALADADITVVSCFPFDDSDQTRDLLSAVTASRLVIDPNPRLGMLRDRDEFVRGFEAAATGAALVKVGADDAAVLYDSPLDALRTRLIDLGARAVLATEGSAGATLEAGEIIVTRPVARLPGQIVDTMGAGDAVLAAAVASMREIEPLAEDEWAKLLERAMEIAAATCRFEGALLRLPTTVGEVDFDHLGT